MWRAFCAFAFFIVGGTSGAWAGESLYWTTSTFLGNRFHTSQAAYVFIAPYFTSVKTTLSVSIAKASAAGNASNSANANKAASPLVLRADWSNDKGGQLTYLVSCDLTSLLFQGDHVGVSQITPPSFGGSNEEVSDVTAKNVVVKMPNDPGTKYANGGVISGVSCPPPADTFAVTFQVTPTPISRGYLYLRRNDLFSDSVNVSVGTDGMLSSSDTSSVQQITAILTELAETAAAVGARFAEPLAVADETREKCYKTISGFVKSAPFYDTLTFSKITHDIEIGSQLDHYVPSSSVTVAFAPHGYKNVVRSGSTIDWAVPVGKDIASNDAVSVHLKLTTTVDSGGQAALVRPSGVGLVAFFPVPATAAVYCSVDHGGTITNTLLNPPTVVNLYTESQILNPVRDFLTGPQDTYTFNSGFITGHKYSNQSSAKTIVDTVTAPIRALMPSVTVTQSVQVQRNANGQVTSTTNTNSTQTAPSKGP